ncbi:MAG: hypothetical protein PHX39_11970 [Bacteroidales bacterium]|nr:hypothetical protein [Bacteroidales bacterium]
MDVRPLTELYTDIRPGYYGEYGGAYVPPALNENLARLAEAFFRYKDEKEFQDEFIHYLKKYVGRPSPLILQPTCRKKWAAGFISSAKT